MKTMKKTSLIILSAAIAFSACIIDDEKYVHYSIRNTTNQPVRVARFVNDMNVSYHLDPGQEQHLSEDIDFQPIWPRIFWKDSVVIHYSDDSSVTHTYRERDSVIEYNPTENNIFDDRSWIQTETYKKCYFAK